MICVFIRAAYHDIASVFHHDIYGAFHHDIPGAFHHDIAQASNHDMQGEGICNNHHGECGQGSKSR